MSREQQRFEEAEDWALTTLLSGGSVIFWLLLIGVASAGGALAWYVWSPVEAAREHEVNVQSHQYQEARKESEIIHLQELMRINTEITRTEDPVTRQALEAQKRVLERRIEREQLKQTR